MVENFPAVESTCKKQTYQTPILVVYGLVSELTQASTGVTKETNLGPFGCSPFIANRKPCSARHMKENISRIGDHPLGFGLYLFDYKPEFKDYAGYGRQFGVMIDEVVGLVPAAVGVDENGYPVVDYTMLGVHRSVCH